MHNRFLALLKASGCLTSTYSNWNESFLVWMREEINCSELSFSRIVEIIVGTHAVHTSVENLFNLLNEVCAADVQNMVAMGTV